MPFPIDLHSHSDVSDGTLSPAALVSHAAARGIRVLALTDHDDTAGLDEAAEAAGRLGVCLIPGVEISVTWKKTTVHVLGLNIDATYAPLSLGLEELRRGRRQRAEAMAESLERAGIAGSLEGARRHARRGIIGRTHFARHLVEQGHARDVPGVFKKYLVRGKPGYHEHRWAELAHAVSWITQSGGTAVLAHPGRYDLGRVNLLTLIAEFRELGGNALEVVSGSHTPEQAQHFARLAHQFGLLASLGSDYHGPGHGYLDMGRLNGLPGGCQAVWQHWPEAAGMA